MAVGLLRKKASISPRRPWSAPDPERDGVIILGMAGAQEDDSMPVPARKYIASKAKGSLGFSNEAPALRILRQRRNLSDIANISFAGVDLSKTQESE